VPRNFLVKNNIVILSGGEAGVRNCTLEDTIDAVDRIAHP
jgi:hypothetical protein